MKNFNVAFPYEIRKGLAIAEAVAAAVGRSEDLGAVGPGYLLSIKESNRKEADETASAEFAFRFEGGVAVRIFMAGQDNAHYGFQWWATQAEVRFRLEGELSDAEKHRMVLGRFSDLQTEVSAQARRLGISRSQREGARRARQIAQTRPPRSPKERARREAREAFFAAFLKPHWGFQALGGGYCHPEYVGSTEPTLVELESQVALARERAEELFQVSGPGSYWYQETSRELCSLERSLEWEKRKSCFAQ